MPKSLQEIVLSTNEDDPMDVDAFSKGKTKGNGKKGFVGLGKGDVKC